MHSAPPLSRRTLIARLVPRPPLTPAQRIAPPSPSASTTCFVIAPLSPGGCKAAAPARSLVLASLIAEQQSESAIAQLFSGEGYGPAPLTEEEERAMGSSPPGEPPLHVHGEYPEWLGAELERVFGPDLLAEMQAMNARASIDLRVNTLRAERDTMLVGLRSLDIKAERTPYSPAGIRVASAEDSVFCSTRSFFKPARSNSRTRRRSLRPISAQRSPGTACWIWRPAPAAKRWR